MLPPWLAHVNERTRTPVNGTIVMLVATAVIGFFTSLNILSNLLSISTLFIFMLVAIALLVRRYYVSGVTTQTNCIKLVVFILLILGSSVATATYWATSDGWFGYVITVPIWLIATAGIWLFVPHAREPKHWGVPLVPWLPSLSIAINIFLLGSIDKASFARFGLWTLIILVYYFFIGLHASYDTAKESSNGEERKNAEEGGVRGDIAF